MMADVTTFVGDQGKHDHQLCFVDLIINGRMVQGLVDYDASHNFLWKELACVLGLRVWMCEASMKEINSKAKATIGVAYTIHIRLDKWKGHANFIVYG